jgi:hypothetical protein
MESSVPVRPTVEVWAKNPPRYITASVSTPGNEGSHGSSY